MHQKPQHVISEKHRAPQFGAEPGDAFKNSGICFGCSVRNITFYILCYNKQTFVKQPVCKNWYSGRRFKIVRCVIYLISGNFIKNYTRWTFIVDTVPGISHRKILMFFFSHLTHPIFNLPSAQDGCNRSLSEPSQNNFTSTLLEFLRDRNVSLFEFVVVISH